MAILPKRPIEVLLIVSFGVCMASTPGPRPSSATRTATDPREVAMAYSRYHARDRTPYQTDGIFSGRLYGSFETAWFRDFREDQVWIFYGQEPMNSGTYGRGRRSFLFRRRGKDDAEPEVDPDEEFIPTSASKRSSEDVGKRDVGIVFPVDEIMIEEMLAMNIANMPRTTAFPQSKRSPVAGPSRSAPPHNKQMN
ncbi:MAG: hypothetical protein R3F21_02545 [Myxococcota bacterium]